jgi:hypothetical protein
MTSPRAERPEASYASVDQFRMRRTCASTSRCAEGPGSGVMCARIGAARVESSRTRATLEDDVDAGPDLAIWRMTPTVPIFRRSWAPDRCRCPQDGIRRSPPAQLTVSIGARTASERQNATVPWAAGRELDVRWGESATEGPSPSAVSGVKKGWLG